MIGHITIIVLGGLALFAWMVFDAISNPSDFFNLPLPIILICVIVAIAGFKSTSD